MKLIVAVVRDPDAGPILDGLMRIDLARALRAPTGWRLDFYVDGVL